MHWSRLSAFILALGLSLARLPAAETSPHAPADANRLTYLDQRDPYYPHAMFARLTTPMWIGEAGVDAVVMLSVDDMGRPAAQSRSDASPAAFMDFLQPLIQRLQRIDGRAPIAVMTCRAQPADPTVQRMLELGLSLDCHSYTHRFPFMRFDNTALSGGDTLQECRQDFLACLENLLQVPGNRPVAYRMPGCDAQNTNSPRFYSEVLPLRTPDGEFLVCDTSVMTWFPSDDLSLPQSMLVDGQGRERFEKYVFKIPQTKNFTNHIRGYPYPYVINNLIWELPVTVPCDSHGVHQNRPRSDLTVDDWKRAIDICVRKQGLCTLLFHTIGYIEAEQLVEVIDYADRTYGHRIKFLNCREVYQRLTENVLDGVPLRSPTGGDNGVRLLDINNDGFLDVVIGNSLRQQTRVWDPKNNVWRVGPFPTALVKQENTPEAAQTGVRFWTTTQRSTGIAVADGQPSEIWSFEDGAWTQADIRLPTATDGVPVLTARLGVDRGVRFRDIDHDGACDLIINNESQNAVYLGGQKMRSGWRRAPFALPAKGWLVDADGTDRGLRFVDLDGDSDDDLIYSNEHEYSVHLFESPQTGWSKAIRHGKSGEPDALPPIVRGRQLGGVWFQAGAMIEENEFTTPLSREFIRRIPFEELVRSRSSAARDR